MFGVDVCLTQITAMKCVTKVSHKAAFMLDNCGVNDIIQACVTHGQDFTLPFP